MNNIKRLAFALICAFTAMTASSLQAATLQQLQQDWAKTNYELSGEAQLKAFERLSAQADVAANKAPDDAALWVWSGIIKSTYAGAKGGLGALKLAKQAKADLERAMSIQPAVLEGSAYASLGTLYLNVPAWPIGFGDKTKAEKLLLKALEINPAGIDSNYFYAEFLRKTKHIDEASNYYQKALAAAPRAGRALADSGRREDIERAIKSL